MPIRYPNSLTREQSRRALWIDFEGRLDADPALAGVLVDDVYTPTILHPDFGSLAKNRNLAQQSFKAFVVETLSHASREERVIAAWSEHELEKMHQFDDGTLNKHYRNANKLVSKFFKSKRASTMKRLRQQLRETAKWGRNRVGLKDLLMLDYVQYRYPDSLSSFSPASAISRMEKQLARHGGNYRKVSTDEKRAFTKLIKYNAHDCRGMAYLIAYVFSRKPNATEIEH